MRSSTHANNFAWRVGTLRVAHIVTNATCDAARLGFNRQHGMDYCCCAEALKVAATKGDALLFFPADAAGEADRRTLHGACPVRDGAKWVAQLWVTDVESLF